MRRGPTGRLMDIVLYIVIGVVILAIIGFVLKGKGDAPEQLPAKDEPDALPDRKPAPAAKGKDERTAPATKPKKQPEPEPSSDEADEEEEEEEESGDEESPPAEVEPEPEAEQAEVEPPVSRRPSLYGSDVGALRKGLARSREEGGFFGRLKALLGGKKEISPEIADEIEEVLIGSDVGVSTTERILSSLKDRLSKGEFDDAGKVWDALREEACEILDRGGRAGAFELGAKPTVVLMVGVNGAGKTTTIGKLARQLESEGQKCVLAAGDTFRAAAVQQLVVWGKRVGCEVVKGKDGADPGSVIFEAVEKAKEVGANVVLADTAGRLHTKKNLMAELGKVVKTTSKAMAGAPHETLLVIDATNGQNALAQAKEFADALPLSGIVLTKLDGTAKGGVILGISDTLGLPVRFIGLGERAEDLHEFSSRDFVEALLGREDTEASAA